jgi:hypothetical protein
MTTVSDAKAPHPESQPSAAERMGLKSGDLVQELGYDDDVDFDLRGRVRPPEGHGPSGRTTVCAQATPWHPPRTKEET